MKRNEFDAHTALTQRADASKARTIAIRKARAIKQNTTHQSLVRTLFAPFIGSR